MIWNELSADEQKHLYDMEYEIETRAIDMGVARYRELRSSSQPSFFTPEQKIIVRGLETLIPAIVTLQKDALAGKSMKGVRRWGPPILSLEADKLALITLVTILNMADTSANKMPAVCFKIAANIKTERYYAMIRDEAPEVFKYIQKTHKNWSPRTMRHAKKRAQIDDITWDTSTRIWIGAVLIEAALKYTRLFEHNVLYSQGKTYKILNLTSEVRQTLEKQHTSAETLLPYYLPMVVPPLPWESLDKGGYLYHNTSLLKEREDHDGKKRVRDVYMPTVYQALNLIQETPFCINRPILDLLKEAWAAGGLIGGLPSAEPLPLPPKAPNIGADPDVLAAWKVKAAAVYNENARIVTQRKAVLHQLWVADRFKDNIIWFPHELDWRSREYPIPVHLHPQGNDSSRALLLFAEKKPLGARGLYWLKIHVANSFDQDKVSFADRLKWVENEYPFRLTNIVKDPFNFKAWWDAKNPWQALAALLELHNALQSGSPEEYASGMPIMKDGSCNGLQHFSALGRDPVGGAAVNLVPNDKPNDIYGSVSDEVKAKIHNDSLTEPEDHVCHNWLGHVNRNVVKRATMTTPYGVTQQGIQTQFISDGWCKDLKGNVYKNAQYLKDVVYDSIGNVVIAAREYMEWLKNVAKISAENGHAISWTTPSGFPVTQSYLQPTTQNIFTTLQRIKVRKYSAGSRISGHKQQRGLPPNLIHSFDAAHMQLTVCGCFNRADILDFVMIHDSYGVHACNVDALDKILREEFVSMYDHPILETLKTDIEEKIGIELPPLPKKGTLDLNVVLESPYFFH